MKSEERIEDMLDCIDAALLKILLYSERQTVALEKLVEQSQAKRKSVPRTKFTPPTKDEVAEYINEIKAGIDPNGFIDYYEARGWKLKGGETVKDWKACVRTWSRNGFSSNPPKETNGVIL